MAAPKALRDRIKVGDVFDVTNHYIKREDHPSYGTTRRTITATNTAAFYMALGGRKANRQEWPRVDRFTVEDDGTIKLYGGGIGQAPTDLFLTLTPVASTLIGPDGFTRLAG